MQEQISRLRLHLDAINHKRAVFSANVTFVISFLVTFLFPLSYFVAGKVLEKDDLKKLEVIALVITCGIFYAFFAFYHLWSTRNLQQVVLTMNFGIIDEGLEALRQQAIQYENDFTRRENELKAECDKYKSDLENSLEGLDVFTVELDNVHSRFAAIEIALNWLRIFLTNPKDRNYKEDLDNMLRPLVAERTQVLDFDPVAVYDFTIFRYNPMTKTLSQFWREYHSDIVPRRRIWKCGEGHIGIAFLNNKTWITPDIMEHEEGVPYRDKFTPEELEIRRSIMSIPLSMSSDTETEGYGAFCITSDEADQFEEVYFSEFCEIYRAILSLYFHFCVSREEV